MLNREETEKLLATQELAYKLLLWLSESAADNPGVLSPQNVALLSKPATALQWLQTYRANIPKNLFPDEIDEAFGNLFSSFFSTSFRVEHFAFGDRLIDARMRAGASASPPKRAGLESCQILALKHLAASEKLPISDQNARRLVNRKSLREASFTWTYVWELDRRARRKGKGEVVHKLWRGLPLETRKTLNADVVWKAREQLLDAARKCDDDLRDIETS